MASNFARSLVKSGHGVGYAADTVGRLAYNASRSASNALKRKFGGGTNAKPRKKPRSATSNRYRRSTSAAQSNTRVVEKELPSRKKRRSVAFKKVKRVKVSRSFRAKVNKALVPKRTSAFCELRDTQYIRCQLDNQQMLFYLGFESTVEASIIDGNCVNTTNTPWHFTPARVLDLVSHAFNAKTSVSINPALGNPDMFGTATNNIKVHVKKSWVTYQIRNNTESTRYMKLWVVAPRKSSLSTQHTYVFDAWKEAIDQEQAMQIIKSDPETTIRQMDLKPTALAAMNQLYKFAETSVTLEPGQCFDFNLPGPEDFTYDFSKYFEPNGATDGSTFHELQKMCRTVIVSAVPDLQINYNTDSPANNMYCIRSGQPTLNTASGQNVVAGVCVEYRAFYDITMPEQAGFVYPVVTTGGTVQPLHHRQNVKVYKNFFNVNPGSLDARVDPEVPSSINIAPQ